MTTHTTTPELLEEIEYRMARDGNRDLQSDEVRRIRQDLDKRSPEKVKADETKAGHAAAADSAVRSGGDEKDRAGIFGMLFGKGKS